MVVFRQSGCIPEKVVLIGQKLFLLGQSFCTHAKVLVIGHSVSIRVKAVVF